MSDEAQERRREDMDQAVGSQEARKLRARRAGRAHIWFGFASFGLIGWSVVLPTVLGIALGVWLDRHHPASFSWTLALLGLGIALGCANAWHWVTREHRALRDEEEQHD